MRLCDEIVLVHVFYTLFISLNTIKIAYNSGKFKLNRHLIRFNRIARPEKSFSPALSWAVSDWPRNLTFGQ